MEWDWIPSPADTLQGYIVQIFNFNSNFNIGTKGIT